MNEEHSYSTFKFINTASKPLKLACKECFWLATSALNKLHKGITIVSLLTLN